MGCTAHEIHQEGVEEGLVYTPANLPDTVLDKCESCHAFLPPEDERDNVTGLLGKGVRGPVRRARYGCPYPHTVWSHGVVLGWMIGRLRGSPDELFGECKDCENWLPP